MINIISRRFDIDAYFLFECDVIESKRRLEDLGSSGLKIAKLKIEDSQKFAKFIIDQDESTLPEMECKLRVERNLASGCQCFIAYDQADIVGYAWLNINENFAGWPDFAKFPGLNRDTGLMLTGFVSPIYRGRGIHLDLARVRLLEAENSGRTRLVSFVGVKNFSSIRNYLKFCRRYRLVYNILMDVPFGKKLSFYLNLNKEKWVHLC